MTRKQMEIRAMVRARINDSNFEDELLTIQLEAEIENTEKIEKTLVGYQPIEMDDFRGY